MNDNSPPVCNYEGSDYQRSFWQEGGRAYEDAVEAIALKRLLPSSGEFMLEVGAGAGRNTPRYKNFKKVALLDYSRSQLEQARDRLGDDVRYLYVAADVYHLPFVSGLFDGATMIRTLHHMADPLLALSQIAEVLRPKAFFILEFANKRNMKSILRYHLRKQSWSPYSYEPVEFAALNFDFHPKAIRNYLKANGFSIIQQLTVSHLRVGILKKHVPFRLLVALDALLQRTGGLIQLSPSVFSLCRLEEEKSLPADGESVFKCPTCQTPIPGLGHDLRCSGCGAVWSFQDGIYDFRQK